MRTELDSPLGKPAPYTEQYAPELLFPIPRAEKRREIGLTEPLPFVGEDVWNAYELSWLDAKGKPAVAVGRFRVPATTPNLIESKSLKLYLNSLNQTSFPDADAVAVTLEKDLSAASGDKVGVEVFLPEAVPRRFASFSGSDCLDALDIDCDTHTPYASYAPEPGFLSVTEAPVVEKTLYSHLLKSNCPVTGQPDWATISVRYRGRPIDAAGLLRYIVSFRRYSEFHEQCVERIYCDLLKRCAPEALAVCARYTRRGGIDINPFRSNGEFPPPPDAREVRQ
ncbi:MAG: NADPH-dependent 7-cyano-7-deazaguanine reductase QueF [Candidatus Accumulibacter sp.]|jgi:7-cyano-7-deazaguanine reductase|nr:NADPH-dependent 7-cyano-7-deazaguanine reductase QueF [Accumulibacter sp.]